MLHAKLLDAPQFALHEKTLSSPLVGKGLALFSYVILQPNAVPRLKLLDLFWSESNEKQARENLRSLLYSLRQVLGDYLTVTRQTVTFNRDLPYWLDVEVFAGIEQVEVNRNVQMLSQVLDLFDGEFLSGIQIHNAPVFDQWVADQRRRFMDLAIVGRQQLVGILWEEMRLEDALAANKRLLELAPWREDAHRTQMRLLADSGQRGAALAHYERCKAQLLEEVNAPPSPETTALYEQIRTQQRTLVPSTTPLSTVAVDATPAETRTLLRVSQGAMPSPRWFVGRADELQTLHRWLVAEKCRVVSILGMGGQGKTTLAARFVQSLVEQDTSAQPAFEGIIWHSLLTAPPLEDILRDWIYQLSDQQVYTLPATLDRQLDLLMNYLTQRRFLLVLDNAESISTAAAAGAPGSYAGYAQLWQILLTRNHRSSLLVTSREWLPQLRNEPETPGIYRRLLLEGLPAADSKILIEKHGVHANTADFDRLQHLYSGNPLALDLAAQTIDELFGGDTGAFLAEESPFVGDIGDVLAQQFARLTALEQEILTWLALEQVPVTSTVLQQCLVAAPPKIAFYDALRALLNRTLIHQDGAYFSLPNVILEFVRGKLLEACYHELTQPALSFVDGVDGTEPSIVDVDTVEPSIATATALRMTQMQLNRYALSRAQAPEDVRAAQKRLVVAPLAQQLKQYWGGVEGVQKLVRRVLASLRDEQRKGAPLTNGYLVGNLLNLLHHDTNQIANLDLSNLTLRQIDLRLLHLHQSDLRNATLDGCLFTSDSSFISSLAFDPGGEFLALGTINGELHLWDLENEEYAAHMHMSKQAVVRMVVGPNGHTVICGGGSGEILVWDVQSGSLRLRKQDIGNMMRNFVLGPDGRQLLYGRGQGAAIWDLATDQHAIQLDAPDMSSTRAVAMTPDGHWIAAATMSGKIYLWRTQGRDDQSAVSPTYVLEYDFAAQNALIFTADARYLYSGGEDGRLLRWDVGHLLKHPEPSHPDPINATPDRILHGHNSAVWSLTCSPDDELLVSSDTDGVSILWDLAGGTRINTASGQPGWFAAHAFVAVKGRRYPYRYLLTTVGTNQHIHIWGIDRRSGVLQRSLHRTLSTYSAAQDTCTFTPDGQFLLSAGADRAIHVWDMVRGRHVKTAATDRFWITKVALSDDGHRLAWGNAGGGLWLANVQPSAADQIGSTESLTLDPPIQLEAHRFWVYGLAFAPGGRLLASADSDAAPVFLWDTDSGRLLQQVDEHTEAVWSLAFDRDGKHLASGGRDGLICVWSVTNAQDPSAARLDLWRKWEAHPAPVREVAFTPDGDRLVSAGNDHVVHIWDLDGRLHRTLTGHDAGVAWLSVSPCRVDGRRLLASADQNHNVRVWDLDSGDLIHAWQQTDDRVYDFAFSPDATTLVTATNKGHLHCWDVRSGALLRTLEVTKPYAGTRIDGVRGLTESQRASLLALGAVE